MPRGAPDYSNVRGPGPIQGSYDQGEMAARLGSPIIYDKAGLLVWMTDFSRGLQGAVPGTNGEGGTYQISSARSHFGPFSLKLDPAATAGSYVEWGSVVQFIESGKVGLEALISHDTDPDGIRLKMLYFDGTTQQRAELHYDPATGDWTVRTGITTWETVIESFKLQQDPTCWNPIKLVIDVENGAYVRVQVAREVEEITQHSLYSLPSPNLGQLACRVMAYGDSDAHAPIYVDAVIVTQQEP